MKRCPTCHQTFEEEWLSFCTQDGTSLIEDSARFGGPPPTVMSPSRPGARASEQPTMNLSPSGGLGQPGAPYYAPPQYAPRPQMQPGWAPVPIAPRPQQGLATASLVVGIFSVTIGWCYVGLVSGPVAVALGVGALVQAKNKPEQYGGKPLAIAGIITGGVPFLTLLLIIILAVVMNAAK
jgi:hypothetical protein